MQTNRFDNFARRNFVVPGVKKLSRWRHVYVIYTYRKITPNQDFIVVYDHLFTISIQIKVAKHTWNKHTNKTKTQQFSIIEEEEKRSRRRRRRSNRLMDLALYEDRYPLCGSNDFASILLKIYICFVMGFFDALRVHQRNLLTKRFLRMVFPIKISCKVKCQLYW